VRVAPQAAKSTRETKERTERCLRADNIVLDGTMPPGARLGKGVSARASQERARTARSV